MELHVTIRDGMGEQVGTVDLSPMRRYGKSVEYHMKVNVDRGPALGHYTQAVLIDQDANPVGALLAALLYLSPEQRVMDGEIVDSSSDSPDSSRYERGGPPALAG
jgi:hypothetical protein